MNSPDDADKRVQGHAEWLRRLAEPEGCAPAARALRGLDAQRNAPDHEPSDHGRDAAARRLEADRAALATLENDLETLIPAWIERFLEQLWQQRVHHREYREAVATGESPPAFDFDNIIAVDRLRKTLELVGERIDPHIGPIIKALGTLDDDCDRALRFVLAHAGAAVVGAVPKLLEKLRNQGISEWPSSLARALASASRFDDRVLVALRDMLANGSEEARLAAMEVMQLIGAAAQPAAGDLLAFQGGNEAERSRMIDALAEQGAPLPEFLDVLDTAMRDSNGYISRAAAHALGTLTPDPDRFVPLLIAACDRAEFLHDESLPDAAVTALGQYGPRARAALPRLLQFLEGPIEGRTAEAYRVREAIERIAAGSITVPRAAIPPRRTEPITADEPLFAVTSQGKQCYIDRQGRLVLQTRFAWGGPFGEGRAFVRDDEGSTFVIDRDGREVFESPWDEIKPFSEGLAAVKKQNKWGFVDREGRVVIEPMHDSVTPFAEGLAGYEVGRQDVRVNRGITWSRSGRRGFMDRSGNVIIPAEWADASSFREGRAVVCTGGTMKTNPISDGGEFLADRKYGYLDRAGRVSIPGDYDEAHSFSEGLAVVRIGGDACRGRYYYIDASGKRIIPLTWSSASAFKDGLALVKRRGRKWRGASLLIDRTGCVLRELRFPVVPPFSEGLTAVWSGDSHGVIDIEGRWVVEPRFDQVEPFKDGLAEVQRGDWHGLIDRSGNFVWGPTTEGVGVVRVIESEWTS